jgi:predicted nucleic acid-binding Zn ribbon protein
MSARRDEKPAGPVKLGAMLGAFLEAKGLEARIEPLRVLEEWPQAVGPTVAAVTRALQLDQQGTLIVDVRTHAWMQELSLLEPELLRALRARPGGERVRQIRWRLARSWAGG